MKKTIDVKNKETIEHYRKLGGYFGYPKCCVNHFINITVNRKISMTEIHKKYKNNYNVSNNTGFIPCTRHTNIILNNRMKLEDIIRNRNCERKFPNGDGFYVKKIRYKRLHEFKFKKILQQIIKFKFQTKLNHSLPKSS